MSAAAEAVPQVLGGRNRQAGAVVFMEWTLAGEAFASFLAL